MDAVFGCGIADDEFVRCRTAGVFAGFNNQRALFRQMAFAIGQRRFDKTRRAEIPENLGRS
jgi:hypothetical protein